MRRRQRVPEGDHPQPEFVTEPFRTSNGGHLSLSLSTPITTIQDRHDSAAADRVPRAELLSSERFADVEDSQSVALVVDVLGSEQLPRAGNSSVRPSQSQWNSALYLISATTTLDPLSDRWDVCVHNYVVTVIVRRGFKIVCRISSWEWFQRFPIWTHAHKFDQQGR